MELTCSRAYGTYMQQGIWNIHMQQRAYGTYICSRAYRTYICSRGHMEHTCSRAYGTYMQQGIWNIHAAGHMEHTHAAEGIWNIHMQQRAYGTYICSRGHMEHTYAAEGIWCLHQTHVVDASEHAGKQRGCMQAGPWLWAACSTCSGFFDCLPRRHNKVAISFQTSWITAWLAMTSHRPISLATKLAINLVDLYLLTGVHR